MSGPRSWRDTCPQWSGGASPCAAAADEVKPSHEYAEACAAVHRNQEFQVGSHRVPIAWREGVTGSLPGGLVSVSCAAKPSSRA